MQLAHSLQYQWPLLLPYGSMEAESLYFMQEITARESGTTVCNTALLLGTIVVCAFLLLHVPYILPETLAFLLSDVLSGRYVCLYELHSAKYVICQDVLLAKEVEAICSSNCFAFSFSQEEPVTWQGKDPVGQGLFAHFGSCVKNSCF